MCYNLADQGNLYQKLFISQLLYEFNFNCTGTAYANGTCSWGSTVSCNSPQNSYETPVYTLESLTATQLC